MKINRDETAGTFTLVPVTPDEIGKVKAIAKVLKPGKKLVYGGIRTDRTTDKLECVYFYAGLKEKWKTHRHPTSGGSSTEMVYIGGVKLELVGSTPADQDEAGSISDICFFGRSGCLFLLQVAQVDEKTALITTGARCKLCHRPMIGLRECEFGICDQDAAKCEHNYVRGATHGGGYDIAVGEFCDKCGKGKPRPEGERKKSVLEQHLAVEKELDIPIIYVNPGAPASTPQEAVQLGRLARRHAKAQARRMA